MHSIMATSSHYTIMSLSGKESMRMMFPGELGEQVCYSLERGEEACMVFSGEGCWSM